MDHAGGTHCSAPRFERKESRFLFGFTTCGDPNPLFHSVSLARVPEECVDAPWTYLRGLLAAGPYGHHRVRIPPVPETAGQTSRECSSETSVVLSSPHPNSPFVVGPFPFQVLLDCSIATPALVGSVDEDRFVVILRGQKGETNSVTKLLGVPRGFRGDPWAYLAGWLSRADQVEARPASPFRDTDPVCPVFPGTVPVPTFPVVYTFGGLCSSAFPRLIQGRVFYIRSRPCHSSDPSVSVDIVTVPMRFTRAPWAFLQGFLQPGPYGPNMIGLIPPSISLPVGDVPLVK